MKHHLSICDGKWWVSIPMFYSNQYLKWLFTLWIHYSEEQQQPCEDSADDSGSSEEEDSDWFVHLFCFIYI